MKILFVTNMYPNAENLASGAFVKHQSDTIKKMGHTVDVLFIRGYRSKLNYLWAFFQVFLRTWRDSYDIVHAHYGLSGLSAIFRWRTPLIITLHGSDILVGKFEPCLSRLACSFANSTIVVAKHMQKMKRSTVIPCGVDLKLFRPMPQKEARLKLQLSQDKKLILFPFNPLKTGKGFDIVKRVVAILNMHGHNVEPVVVFDVPNTQMPLYYNAVDAMILCSDSEGSPTSIKEALACNTPVVSTRVGDVTEIMKGIKGVKLCEQNAECLANGLSQLLFQKNEEIFDSRTSMQRYSQKCVAKAIVKVYETVLSNRTV